MTTFSIASILGDTSLKHEDGTSSSDDPQTFILNNSVQHLYNVLCKNAVAAAAAAAVRLNEHQQQQHQQNHHHHQQANKTNLIRSFPIAATPHGSPSTDFYAMHKLSPTSYPGNEREGEKNRSVDRFIRTRAKFYLEG